MQCSGGRASVFNLAMVIVTAAVAWSARAADPAETPSFEQKTVTLINGGQAGGGVDTASRLVGAYLTKYLPGNPVIVVHNMLGAAGMVSLNFFVQQVKPDGMTITWGSASQLDPRFYRQAKSQYDPSTFKFIGGISRGGTFIIVGRAGEQRLLEVSADPVSMGAVAGTRSSEQMVSWGMEFLDWNVKWVVGYRGSVDTTLALERGELDMATTGNSFLIKRLLDTGDFKLLAQSGDLINGQFRRRSDFAGTPVLSELIEGRLHDPTARAAFGYWEALIALDQWGGLPPDTPAPMVAAYREAFRKVMSDPEFLEKSKKISEDIGPLTHDDVESSVKKAAAMWTPESAAFLVSMQAKQGLRPRD